MEPLDPKAELMRLADDYAGWFAADEHYSTEHRRHNRTESRAVLSAAIGQALADARRLALEEAAKVCEIRAESEQSPSWAKASVACAYCIRTLVDGKAGGT